MSKLSVVVPVYNAEKYLSRCIDSLFRQDVGDYEIVCVNDGSTDRSGLILHEYKKMHPEVISIVEQENKGLPAARNAGMAVARGDIIAFCDADDYVIPGAYGYLLRTFWKECADILKFSSITMDRYVQKNWRETNDVHGKLLYEGSGMRFVVEKEPNFSFVWSYFYKKDFLKRHRLQFQPIRQCEDVAFNLDVYMHDPYVLQVSSSVYRYTVSPEQVTRIREPRHMREVVASYVRLFSNMNTYMREKKEVKDILWRYKQREIVPCMSRVLSAAYSKVDFQSVKVLFLQQEILPMRMPSLASRIINTFMSNYNVYMMASFLYRKVFVPYILPRLSRN